MTSIAIKLGFEPAKLNWSAVATVKRECQPTQAKQRKPPGQGPRYRYGREWRQNRAPKARIRAKWDLPKGLNKRDHAAYVKAWRAKRKAHQPTGNSRGE